MQRENQMKRHFSVIWSLVMSAVFLGAGLLLTMISIPENSLAGGTMTTRTIIGTLTNKGVECPAMIGDDGQLYSLLGNIMGFQAGQRIEVEARKLERLSPCRRGTTVEIKSIKAAHDK